MVMAEYWQDNSWLQHQLCREHAQKVIDDYPQENYPPAVRVWESVSDGGLTLYPAQAVS